MMGLVPVTSPRNKSQGLVASCELAIFATKSSHRIWSMQLDFEAKMASSHNATAPSLIATSHRDELPVHMMQLVPATCCRD